MQQNPITIYCADIFDLYYNGLQMAIKNEPNHNFKIIGNSKTISCLINNVSLYQPNVILLSHQLLDGYVFKHFSHIKYVCPNVKIVMLTMAFSMKTMLKTIGKIDGFIGKDAEINEIIHCLKLVLQGEKYFVVSGF